MEDVITGPYGHVKSLTHFVHYSQSDKKTVFTDLEPRHSQPLRTPLQISAAVTQRSVVQQDSLKSAQTMNSEDIKIVIGSREMTSASTEVWPLSV